VEHIVPTLNVTLWFLTRMIDTWEVHSSFSGLKKILIQGLRGFAHILQVNSGWGGGVGLEIG
jgi:hypothetical protein